MNFKDRTIKYALITIILSGAFVRCFQITKNPTWWDEHANVFTASGALVEDDDSVSGLRLKDVSSDRKIKILENEKITTDQILSKCRLKNIFKASIYWDLGNGLAYTMPLHFWLNVFGYSDAAIRSLSCLFGILVIPAGYFIAKKISGSRVAGLIAAALLASNSLLIEYSIESRSYSLAVLLSLLSTYVFLKIINDESRNYFSLIVYVILLSLLAFAHYLAVPVLIIAHFAGAIFSVNRTKSLISWLIGVTFMGLSLFLWMTIGGASKGLEGMRHMDSYWLQNALAGTYSYVGIFHLKDTLRMLVERSVWFLCPLFKFWPLLDLINLLFLSLFLFTIFYGLILVLRNTKSSISGITACMVFSLGMCYSFILSYKSGHTLPFINRYNLFYIPYQQILIATGVVYILRVKNRIMRYILLIISVIGLSKITYSNLKYALHAKPKATFSFDHIIDQCNDQKPHILYCQDQDSAIIASLKIKKTNKNNASIIINKSCKSKVILDDQKADINY